jgi:hypothetical protein
VGRIMIKCPVTGKPLPTGIGIDKKSWENPSNQFSNNQIGPCPHCGQMHTWSKKDAYYED